MSTMETWYQGAWSRRNNTPEGYALLKESQLVGEGGREFWERTSSDHPVVVAIVGDREAELPECHIVMNKENHSFSVKEFRSDGDEVSLRSATFMELSQWRGVTGSSHCDIPQDQADRRKGQLMLYHLNGRIAGEQNPAYSTRLSIGFDALVQSTTWAIGAPKDSVVAESAPWPGIENDDDWLWVPYPEFNEYDTLIARAREAFEFFLSGRDPRTPVEPVETRTTPVVVASQQPAAPRPRTQYSADLTYSATRSTPITDDEQALIDQTLQAMPPAKGEGLTFFGPWGQPPTLLEGSSALWDNEPVEDIINDLHNKLNGLTLIRHILRHSEWTVSLSDMDVLWNPELGRFEPPQ